MRMPSIRFTIQRMMVIVAVGACILWATVVLQERRRRFLRIASEHEKELRLLHSYYVYYYPFEIIEWLDEMKKKYEYAAAHPWLPIESDPPVPSLFGGSSAEPLPPMPEGKQSPFH